MSKVSNFQALVRGGCPSPLRRRVLASLLWVGIVGAATASLWADIRLPKIFGDSMVLQRQAEVHLYGAALPNESLVLSISGSGIESRELKTVCDSAGEFSIKFSPPPVGGPYELILTGADSKVVIRDVLVGDVWLCAGQSNMEWPIDKSAELERTSAAIERPQLRLLTVPKTSSQQPLTDYNGIVSWNRSNAQTAAGFSAVGWHFGSYLEQDLQVPIGLIQASWGGTKAEAWTSFPALAEQAELEPLLVQAGLVGESTKQQDRLAGLYNGMIAPLRRFPIKGVIWYQGEANVGRGQQYRTLLPTLIRDWRLQWSDPHLPFIFVQLAPYRYKNQPPQALPEVWEAQLTTWKTVPRTGIIAITDLGNPDDVHPIQKQEVARRLSLWTMAEVYRGQRLLSLPEGESLAETTPPNQTADGKNETAPAAPDYCGPLFRGITIENQQITVSFYADRGLKSADDQPLRGFSLAGEDQVFHPAQAVIVDHLVVVSSPDVPAPVAVRYAWTDTPSGNLTNAIDLPASPFRSDDFPLLSREKHY
jgi:sialate O-acetylesterase